MAAEDVAASIRRMRLAASYNFHPSYVAYTGADVAAWLDHQAVAQVDAQLAELAEYRRRFGPLSQEVTG